MVDSSEKSTCYNWATNHCLWCWAKSSLFCIVRRELQPPSLIWSAQHNKIEPWDGHLQNWVSFKQKSKPKEATNVLQNSNRVQSLWCETSIVHLFASWFNAKLLGGVWELYTHFGLKRTHKLIWMNTIYEARWTNKYINILYNLKHLLFFFTNLFTRDIKNVKD